MLESLLNSCEMRFVVGTYEPAGFPGGASESSLAIYNGG